MTAAVACPTVAPAGGFQHVHTGGRWQLRLAGRGPASDPLVITGERVGPDAQLGLDELEHAIIRLLAPATRWLITGRAEAGHGSDRADQLFGLIAQAWRGRREPDWSSGRLQLHRAALDRPAGVRYWEPDATHTNQLDLVVWRDDAGRQVLLNVYPAGPTWSARGWASLPAALDSVVAVRDRGRLVGSGVVVGTDSVLTARHVVAGRAAHRLTVDRRSRVAEVVTVPLPEFGRDVELATLSCALSRSLTGIDQPTVDLALLAVPGLGKPASRLRRTPVRPGEPIAVAGYPQGRWTVALGPVTSSIGADLRAHLIAGPGTSGGPAIDGNGDIAGVLTMGHPLDGELLVGPPLLTSFLAAAQRMRARRVGSDG